MKRFWIGTITAVALMASAPLAFAGISYCESLYIDGEECYTTCTHWDDQGNYLGKVHIDYNC